MKNLLCLSLLLISIPFTALAQNGGSWTPQTVFAGDTLTILFDAALNNEGLSGSSTMTLHWGVNETGPGNWQTPDSSTWPVGTVLSGLVARSPMTEISNDHWQVKVFTNQTISTLHFVVNDGTPETEGQNWGHNTDGTNWDLTVFQGNVTATFVNPIIDNSFNNPKRAPAFVLEEDSLEIIGSAVVFDFPLDSLKLYVDGSLVAEEASTDTIKYMYVYENFAEGYTSSSLIAYSAGVSDTAQVLILNVPLPATETTGIKPGINYVDDNSVILSLFAPYKDYVFLIGDFNNWEVSLDYSMNKYAPDADSTLWILPVTGLEAGKEYAFQYLVNGELRIADPYTHKVLDPWNDKYIPSSVYPDLKPYPDGKTQEPVSIIQTAQIDFDWIHSGSFSRPPKENLIVYELLLRDFLANHDYKTLIDTLNYLKELGINAIELMPINEFEGNISWGYNPSFYFAPDKYYGPENDLKAFIDEAHSMGMAVIIDMVLNHSYGQSPMVRLYFDHIDGVTGEIISKPESPWFNVMSPNRSFFWGADYDHESSHTQYFMDRVNRYWLEEFKVDGFRFDFTKGFTNKSGDGWARDEGRIAILERMANSIWAYSSSAYVILEHLSENSEEKTLSDKGMMLWGNMNSKYSEATMGYHQGGKSDFSEGYYKNRGWTKPNLVTYMESHDEERLMFRNLEYGNSSGYYNIKDLPTALERQKMVSAFFFLYPGPKMIWQFGELGYDISIDDPGRVDPKPILWEYLEDEHRLKLYKTYQAIINLRKTQFVFRDKNTIVEMFVNDTLKLIKLNSAPVKVVIVGNFGTKEDDIIPYFHHTGWWYDFFSGDSIEVTGTTDPLHLYAGNFNIYSDVKFPTPEEDIIVGIDTGDDDLNPPGFELGDAYPNPFNPSTTIPFSIAKPGNVEIIIYNVMGQKVKTLVNANYATGKHHIAWNGNSNSGSNVSSGFYFVRLKATGFEKVKRILLIK